jgi:hypothetical protein
MSSLSPTAMRFIGLALAQQGDKQHEAEWRAWADSPEEALSPHLAQLALHALSGMALRADDRLADDATASAEAAQLENDIGYIADVEAVLLEHLHQPMRAFG